MASEEFANKRQKAQEPITFAEKTALASAAMATAVASTLEGKYKKDYGVTTEGKSKGEDKESEDKTMGKKKDDFDAQSPASSTLVHDSEKIDDNADGNEKQKTRGGESQKRPLGKNEKSRSKQGKHKTTGRTRTKRKMEEELHPELLKIYQKKRIIVQCGVSAFLILIAVGAIGVMKWHQNMPAKRRKLVIPDKIVRIVPLATAPKPAAVLPASSLDDEFKKLRRKVRKMPSKSLEGINAKIKIWQKFLDKNEKDHPDDMNIMKTHAILKNLENVKTYY